MSKAKYILKKINESMKIDENINEEVIERYSTSGGRYKIEVEKSQLPPTKFGGLNREVQRKS